MMFSLFISCSKGLEYLLADEMTALALSVTAISPQGVYVEASLERLYRICLWSRLASRVQLILFKGEVTDVASLYTCCHAFAWRSLFDPQHTLAIEFHGHSPAIRHSVFGAQVIKDAIVDYFRHHDGVRPTIDKTHPDIRLHAYLKHQTLTVSLDVTGYSLHQRGYRLESGVAPLKENLACALLMRAKWPERAAEGFAFHDPFCGSGTLVIEAAMIAANIAPGLLRQDQAFSAWKGHNPALWAEVRTAALAQRQPISISLYGTDSDDRVIAQAKANALRAGVADLTEFATIPIQAARPLSATSRGLVVTNPPYGERLQDQTQLAPLYQCIGQTLHTHYSDWETGIFTSNEHLAKAIGLRAKKQYTFYNGALPCKLYCIAIDKTQTLRDPNYQPPRTPSAEMFANRLKKNAAHYQKWAKRNQISCYRVYDADLPEYAFAIDLYENYVVLQEYAPPQSIPSYLADKRRHAVLQATPEVLGLPPAHLIFKERKPQKGTHQYQKLNETRRYLEVQEGKARFNVNLYDYLDTGLFLDHRLLRLKFAKLPARTRFLNCFCYTATASVQAALAGALTTNVDLSNTYLTWAEENFRLNHLNLSKHQFIQYNCLEWLQRTRDRFDVIFLDPPSFSNSKRMEGTLDIQRDHEQLIDQTMRLLAPQGRLYFSTNYRGFKLSATLLTKYDVNDISAQTIDIDFKRNARIHQCFELRESAAS